MNDPYGSTSDSWWLLPLTICGALYLVYITHGVDGFFGINTRKQTEKPDNTEKLNVTQQAIDIINKNQKSLAIRRSQTVFLDPYGKEDTRTWINKEIPYFISEHLEKPLGNAFWLLHHNDLIKKIDAVSKS